MTRRQAVLALVLGAVAVLASTAPVWLLGSTTSALDAVVPLSATGAAAAPGVTAGGAVVLAAALALALGRRAGAVLAATVAALAGLLVAVAAAGAPARARAVLGGAAADQVGVGEVKDVVVTAWPWVAVAAGLVVTAVAVGALVAARGWQGPSARHEAPGAPTGGAGEVEAPARPDLGPSPEPRPGRDPGAVWDALSRGEDPT